MNFNLAGNLFHNILPLYLIQYNENTISEVRV